MLSDVERQEEHPLLEVPSSTWQERFFDFFEYYFGSMKLYFYSFPMPDVLWDNRKWRLKASGVIVTPRPAIDPIVDRIVHIAQQQPSE
ncbi:unnamed protein product [Caenorhabditis sp. 36 PRJEB53466]|nr:unnamed protein product [Caenorhabditis sp. 36 PRJEB53466]